MSVSLNVPLTVEVTASPVKVSATSLTSGVVYSLRMRVEGQKEDREMFIVGATAPVKSHSFLAPGSQRVEVSVKGWGVGDDGKTMNFFLYEAQGTDPIAEASCRLVASP